MAEAETKDNGKGPKGYSFGTFKGVFTPSILTVLGVVMYLRFGWALGSVGLVSTLFIITIASAITFFTALSLSALATNMKVEGGGAYFIISRSLGIEAGAAVGLPLFFAQALGISFYIAGFSESLVAEFPGLVPLVTTRLGFASGTAELLTQYDAQIVGVVTLLLITAIAYRSADLALKSQFVIMVIIAVSLVSFFFGDKPGAELASIVPKSLPVKTFWPVFAVIFPAVTGIEAGIAMSGDLKKPAYSLPRGTMGAVLLGYVVYVSIIIFLWSTVGDQAMLAKYPMMMRYVAKWGRPVLLGIWAASLSSAMGALLGAPRTLQALARDCVIPRIFGRGFGKGNDPRIATATAFIVGLIGIVAGDLNRIGTVLTLFFLTSYGLLNVSAGLEELASPPSWRPKFRIPWIVSLLGAFGCFAAMFMIHAGATFIAAFVAIGVYFIMERRSLAARWGDMRSGILMMVARNAIHGLARRKPDERTWKPNILVLSGSPAGRWHLIALANAIAQDRSFLTIAAIVPRDTDPERVKSISSSVEEYLEKNNVSALVKVYPSETALTGAQTLARAYGYGPIIPNTILLGETENPEHYEEFARLISQVNGRRQNLVVVREGEDVAEEGEKKRVDLWWYGTRQNLGFMMALVYLLRRSDQWKKAELILKSIVDEGENTDETQARLDDFVKEARLNARAEVITRKSEDVFDIIRANSQGADLVFLGIRAPGEDEPIDDYCRYYRELLRKTEGLPPAAMILAAEEVDFQNIFERL